MLDSNIQAIILEYWTGHPLTQSRILQAKTWCKVIGIFDSIGTLKNSLYS